ncbi:hypothetical protein HDU76_009372, partial [Blyttiomyces sp. JEL0837]
VAEGDQLDLDRLSNRVLSYDDTIVSKLTPITVPSIPGENIKYEVHCNPSFSSSTNEGGSTTSVAKRAGTESVEPTGKRHKSSSTSKGKEPVVDLTQEVAVRLPNTDFGFLVNRIQKFEHNNPYQLALEEIKHYPLRMSEVLDLKKLPNINVEYAGPNEAMMIAAALLLERYSAVGLDGLVQANCCRAIERFIESIHANQKGVAEPDSEVQWDQCGSVISGQVYQYDFGSNLERLESINDSIQDIMVDHIQCSVSDDKVESELASYDKKHIQGLLQGKLVKEHCVSIMDTCLPIYVTALRHMYPGFEGTDMDHIHCSGNSLLRSNPECSRQYPHCDSFENDAMSFLVQITSSNTGTEICCQEITFWAPFLKDDPFGAHYHTDGHEKLTGDANPWFRKSFEHILIAEDSDKYRSKCVEYNGSGRGSAMFFTGRALHNGQPPKRA